MTCADPRENPSIADGRSFLSEISPRNGSGLLGSGLGGSGVVVVGSPAAGGVDVSGSAAESFSSASFCFATVLAGSSVTARSNSMIAVLVASLDRADRALS